MYKKGFTLAELLLCLGIIGIVSAMGLVVTKHSADKAFDYYYYNGYINLFNAIAEAHAQGRDSKAEIQEYASNLLGDGVSSSAEDIPTLPNGGGNSITSEQDDAFEVFMSVPQRKTRTNNGYATVKFIYLNQQGGLLVPVQSPDENAPNLQERRDLLPVYIDNGLVGRVSKNSSGQNTYNKKAIYSYKEAYCKLYGDLSISGNQVVSCGDIAQLDTNSPNVGFIKIADPRKVR